MDIRNHLSVIEDIAKELNVIDTAFDNVSLIGADDNVSNKIANDLFGSNIAMTYSRLETYVKCPFSYFCKYVLGLKEKKYGYFAQSDMGTYIHRILEKSINTLFTDGNITKKSALDIESALNTSFNEVVSAIVGHNNTNEGKRFEALLTRLKRTVTLISENIVEEFKNSDFRPKFFELEIGKGDGAVPPLKIDIDGESTMSVYGKIDRVDTYEKDGTVYVRVLDYKSGTTEHALDNVKHGLDTQMLLYLFSIWKDGSEEFKKLINSDIQNVVPAGVLYQKASITTTPTKFPLPPEIARQKADETLVRSGMLIDDADILNAMEHGLEGKFLPVKSIDGELKAKDNVLATIDTFDSLYTDISNILSSYGKKMKSGAASASPISLPRCNPCQYCKLYPICRNKNNGGNADADE